MKKILFATDFSDHAPIVFKYAVELAYFFKAQLLVMHAHGKPEPRLEAEPALFQKSDRVIERLTEFVVQHIPEAYSKKIKVDFLAVHAYPVEGILKVAFDREVNLIVLGMTGKTNALGSVLGNTTLNVLAKADCQVLMIPEGAYFAGIDNLVYTADLEFRDLEAIHYLKKWSKALFAPLHVLHVVEVDENEGRVRKDMMILRETFKRGKTIDFDLRYGDFRQEIEQYAKSKQADIVAMISHKRNLLSRLVDTGAVEGVAKRIHLPLLVIKEDAYEFGYG